MAGFIGACPGYFVSWAVNECERNSVDGIDKIKISYD
jgi:hypothetical protein